MPTNTDQERTKTLYDLQWNRYRIVRSEEDQASLQLKTGLSPEEFVNLLVLDGGCGMGRYARVAASWGANVLGMDLSLAVNSAREMTAEYHDSVQIIRGDLLRVPICEGSFDLVYSIGVLDHTPDPRQAFLNLAKCVKPGGRMAVWVYQVQSPKVEKIMKLHRSIASLMPVKWIERLSRWSVPIGGVKSKLMNSRIWIVQKLGLAVHALTIGVSMHPDPEVRACDTLDWYAPEFVSHHTPEEVEGWFREAGFSKVFDPTLDRPFFYEGQGQGVHRVGIK